MIDVEDLQALVEDAQYYRFPNTTVTVCCLKLTNGFDVVGYSACIDLEDFHAKTGEKIAFDNAFDRLWELEGYKRK